MSLATRVWTLTEHCDFKDGVGSMMGRGGL